MVSDQTPNSGPTGSGKQKADSSADDVKVWADEVRRRLDEWGRWSAGHQLIRRSLHPLQNLRQRAMDDMPGTAPISDDFTLAIEAVDKAVGRLVIDAQALGGRRMTYIRDAKRILMTHYVGRKSARQIADERGWPPEHVLTKLWFAEAAVARALPLIEIDLQNRDASTKIGRVQSPVLSPK